MNMVAMMLAFVSSPMPSNSLVLVDQGAARCCIVIPSNATPTVKQSAGELQKYMKRISGAELKIEDEKHAGTGIRIDVGPTTRAVAALPDGLLGDQERIRIRSGPDGIVLCGGGDRGTQFAVYRFLEELGCRWLTSQPENDVVPRRSTIAVGRLDIDTRPAFQWRFFIGMRLTQSEPWGVKLGLNGLYTRESAKNNGNCYYYPRGYGSVHEWCNIIPNSPYFAKHPEWFPLLGGKRVPTDAHGRQLCVTASGLADTFATNVLRTFDEDPTCQLMSISPNDGYGWCECPACADLDKRLCDGRTTQQGLGTQRPFRGDRVFWFANQVATRVAKKYPNKKLLVLAYVNYAEPPDTIRPAANVVPFVCHYAPADYGHAIEDPRSKPNRQFDQLLRKWTRISSNIMIYSYVSKSMWWRLPRPVLKNFAQDIKYYHRQGIDRYFCQSTLSDWPLDGPLYYVIAKLLWDPEADPQVLARQWIDGMFGPAANEMAAYYEAVARAVRKTGKPYSDNPPRDVPGLYDEASLRQAIEALERARRIAAEPQLKARITKVATTFHYGYHMIHALEAHERFLANGDPESLRTAIAERDKAFSYCRVADAATRTGSWTLNAEIGVPANGFGKPEQKGGRRCWNADETGVGDNAAGWATFIVRAVDRKRPIIVEMDVWGESEMGSLVIRSKPNVWNRVDAERRCSGKPRWEKLIFHISTTLFAPNRIGQTIGFGGADKQVWVAHIRAYQEDDSDP